MRKGLIDKWAFPCNLFNLSSLQKTGHEKTLLTRSLAAVFADTMAEVLDFIAKGEYKIFIGYAKGKGTAGDLKEKQRKPIIGFRADIPFDERHGMRFETTYNKNKIDTYDKEGKKLNGIISKTATVYSGYTCIQSVSESIRFRSSISLGYSTSKRNVLWQKGAAATSVSSKGEHLIDSEIHQNLVKAGL